MPAGDIPSGWEAVPLGDLLEFSNGVNADKSAYGEGVPFVNVLEVITHETLTDALIPGRVTLPPPLIARFQVRNGDILFNRTSETQDELGLTSVYIGNATVVFGGFVFRGRPKTDRLDVGYSKYALRSNAVREQIVARGQGAIRANIGQRDLKTVQVVLPPPDEQRALARVVSDVAGLIARLEQSEMKKRAITKGLAQELLGGKTRLPGFTEPWRKDCAIADLCEKRTGYWGSDVMAGSGARRARVIRAGDITADGRLTGAADRYFTASQWKYAACRVDDVVITASGNGLGKTFYVADQSGLAASNFVRILRPKAGVSGEYLAHVMRSAPAKAMLETHTATSAYPNLMPSFFTEPWLSIPGYDEQMAIAATLRSSDDETARTRALLAKIKDVKQGMLQELLTGRTRLPVEVAA